MSLPIADAALEPRLGPARTVWRGFRRLDVIDTEVTPHPDRAPSRIDIELLRVGRVAAVLPYDPVTGEVVLIRQFRLGAHLAHGHGLNIEVVAGMVDPGEAVEDAARRELREEAGLEALALEPLFDYVPAPAASDENARFFLARVDTRGLPAVTGEADEQEVIEPFAARPEAVRAAITAGRIRNGYVISAIAWFLLMQPEIDRRWSAP